MIEEVNSVENEVKESKEMLKILCEWSSMFRRFSEAAKQLLSGSSNLNGAAERVAQGAAIINIMNWNHDTLMA